MSNTKFTEGEWKIKRVDDCSPIHIGPVYDNTDMINTVCTTCRDDGADAHLIAAAPEMYELLGQFRDFAVRQGWQHVLINQADELLARARGEQ